MASVWVRLLIFIQTKRQGAAMGDGGVLVSHFASSLLDAALEIYHRPIVTGERSHAMEKRIHGLPAQIV